MGSADIGLPIDHVTTQQVLTWQGDTKVNGRSWSLGCASAPLRA